MDQNPYPLYPYPYPQKPAQTRTRARGYGFLRVGVGVGPLVPGGYPWWSLVRPHPTFPVGQTSTLVTPWVSSRPTSARVYPAWPLAENHDPPAVRHPGQHWMIKLVKWTYWWPSMRNNIKKYIKGCDTCQCNKVQHEKKAAPLHLLPIPSAPWEEISIDLIGPLPKSGENNAILVIVDRFSKMIWLKATRTDLTSMQLAEIYWNEIWKLHGIPQCIISDCGPQFASEFTKNLLKGIGSECGLSTAYHPQTDSQTEQVNQEVEGFLRMFCNY